LIIYYAMSIRGVLLMERAVPRGERYSATYYGLNAEYDGNPNPQTQNTVVVNITEHVGDTVDMLMLAWVTS
jgi:hypothetical protein